MRAESGAIYLKDNENIDAGQDDPGDGHLRLHADVERLVGHGQRHHLVVLQEGLDADDDGVAVCETGSGTVYVLDFFVMFVLLQASRQEKCTKKQFNENLYGCFQDKQESQDII